MASRNGIFDDFFDTITDEQISEGQPTSTNADLATPPLDPPKVSKKRSSVTEQNESKRSKMDQADTKMPRMRRPNALQIPSTSQMVKSDAPPPPTTDKPKPDFPKFNVTVEPGKISEIDFDDDQKPKSIIFKQVITVNLKCEN